MRRPQLEVADINFIRASSHVSWTVFPCSSVLEFSVKTSFPHIQQNLEDPDERGVVKVIPNLRRGRESLSLDRNSVAHKFPAITYCIDRG